MTRTEEWKTFERDWADMIVESVNRLREAAGLTVKDLASRLSMSGWPVSVATLSGILSGHKRGSISVTEWMAFAWALNVSPLYLVIGYPTHAQVPPSPMWDGTSGNVDTVAAWVAGEIAELPASPGANIWELQRLFGRDAALNLVTHAVMMQRVRWQAANIIARSQLPDEYLRDFAHPDGDINDAFRSTLVHLAAIRAEERSVDDAWRLALEPLPEVLRFIDDLTHSEALHLELPQLTIQQLRTLVSSADIDAANASISTSRKTMQILRARETESRHDGAPTNAAE